MTFNDEGIQVEFADCTKTGFWGQVCTDFDIGNKKTRIGQSTSEIACYVEGKMLQERRNHILQKVTENGKVRVADLSRDLAG